MGQVCLFDILSLIIYYKNSYQHKSFADFGESDLSVPEGGRNAGMRDILEDSSMNQKIRIRNLALMASINLY